MADTYSLKKWEDDDSSDEELFLPYMMNMKPRQVYLPIEHNFWRKILRFF